MESWGDVGNQRPAAATNSSSRLEGPPVRAHLSRRITVGSYAQRCLVEHSSNVGLRNTGPFPEVPAAVNARHLAKSDVTVRRRLVHTALPARDRHSGDVQFSG